MSRGGEARRLGKRFSCGACAAALAPLAEEGPPMIEKGPRAIKSVRLTSGGHDDQTFE